MQIDTLSILHNKLLFYNRFSLFALNKIFQNKRSCVFNIFNKFFFYIIRVFKENL